MCTNSSSHLNLMIMRNLPRQAEETIHVMFQRSMRKVNRKPLYNRLAVPTHKVIQFHRSQQISNSQGKSLSMRSLSNRARNVQSITCLMERKLLKAISLDRVTHQRIQSQQSGSQSLGQAMRPAPIVTCSISKKVLNHCLILKVSVAQTASNLHSEDDRDLRQIN